MNNAGAVNQKYVSIRWLLVEWGDRYLQTPVIINPLREPLWRRFREAWYSKLCGLMEWSVHNVSEWE